MISHEELQEIIKNSQPEIEEYQEKTLEELVSLGYHGTNFKWDKDNEPREDYRNLPIFYHFIEEIFKKFQADIIPQDTAEKYKVDAAFYACQLNQVAECFRFGKFPAPNDITAPQEDIDIPKSIFNTLIKNSLTQIEICKSHKYYFEAGELYLSLVNFLTGSKSYLENYKKQDRNSELAIQYDKLWDTLLTFSQESINLFKQSTSPKVTHRLIEAYIIQGQFLCKSEHCDLIHFKEEDFYKFKSADKNSGIQLYKEAIVLAEQSDYQNKFRIIDINDPLNSCFDEIIEHADKNNSEQRLLWTHRKFFYKLTTNTSNDHPQQICKDYICKDYNNILLILPMPQNTLHVQLYFIFRKLIELSNINNPSLKLLAQELDNLSILSNAFLKQSPVGIIDLIFLINLYQIAKDLFSQIIVAAPCRTRPLTNQIYRPKLIEALTQLKAKYCELLKNPTKIKSLLESAAVKINYVREMVCLQQKTDAATEATAELRKQFFTSQNNGLLQGDDFDRMKARSKLFNSKRNEISLKRKTPEQQGESDDDCIKKVREEWCKRFNKA